VISFNSRDRRDLIHLPEPSHTDLMISPEEIDEHIGMLDDTPLIVRSKERCGKCSQCQIEDSGCGCDGAFDDGCFLCTPSLHKRLPCSIALIHEE